MKIYLCGPIGGCTDEECKNWRDMVTKQGYETIDPMRRDYRGREGDFSKEIVEEDKIDIFQSDMLLVNYIKPSVGTSMEILFAWEQNKTIIVVTPKGTSISPWLKYHSHYIVNSFPEALKILDTYE
jgi:hypothetical protein